MDVKEAAVEYLPEIAPQTREEDVPPGYKRTEVGVIPEDWRSSTVRELAALSANAIVGGPFGSDLVSRDYVSAGVPVIRGQNMAQHYVSGEFVFVTSSKARSLQANLAHPGDIVFTQRGSLGQVALVSADAFTEYLISQSQMKVSFDSDQADARYVYQYFTSTEGQNQIADSAIQTGVPHTNLGILRCYFIPTPPTVTEQRAIATALSDADALIAALQRLLVKKRAIKRGTMQALLTGRQRLPGFTGEWASRQIKDVFNLWASDSKSKYISKGGIRFIVDMGAVDRNGRLIVSKRTNYGGDLLSKGDLIMPKDDIGGGNIIGRAAYIDADNKYVLGDHVYALRALSGYSKFFSYLINENEVNSALRRKVAGSAQLGLGRKMVLEQVISFPCLEEQTAIATVLSDMDAEIEALEARLAKTCALKAGMMQQLLTGRIRLPLEEAA